MKITVNGQQHQLVQPVTVAVLLDTLGVAEKRVAVEINREIIPRSRHADFQVNENDQVEVVFAIGGG